MNLKPKTVLPHLPEVPSGLDALAHPAGGGQRALSDAELEKIAGGNGAADGFIGSLESGDGLLAIVEAVQPGPVEDLINALDGHGENLSDVVLPGFGGATYVDAAQTIAEGDIVDLLKALDPDRGG